MRVLTVGCFDVLHQGHANLLRQMAKRGDVYVLLHDDRSIWINKGRFPVQNYNHRWHNLKASGLAKGIIEVRKPDPSETIKFLCLKAPHDWLFMRGDDWIDFPGKRELERLQVPIEYVPYTEGVSTTEILCESK